MRETTLLILAAMFVWACGSDDDAPSADAQSTIDAPASVDASAATDATPVFDAAPLGGTSASSLQIQAVVTATPGTVDLNVDDVVVTYVKPDMTGDVPGFFVQAEQIGPALFVTADAANPVVTPLVGDRVSFHVSETVVGVGTIRAIAIDSFSTADTGIDVEPLRQDLSAAADVSTDIDRYASELIHIEAVIAGAWEPGSTGHERAPITTTAITQTQPVGDGGLWLRLPVPMFDTSSFLVGCTVTLDGILWRFNADPQPHSYDINDVSLTCPPSATD